MQISVHVLSHADRAEWAQLYSGYAEFYEVPMNEAILETVWGWIHGDNTFYGLVAKNHEGQCVGLAHCRQMASPLRGVQVGFLDDLFVSPEARGRGVIEALFVALEELGRKNGWPFIRWLTADNNYRARSVYDGLAERTHWITYQMPVRLSDSPPVPRA